MEPVPETHRTEAPTDEKLRITHVIDQLAKGGAERMLVDLAICAFERGHVVSICITRSGNFFEVEIPDDLNVVQASRKHRFNWREIRHTAALLQEQQADVLHVHGRSSLALIAMIRQLGWVKTRVVFHDHDGQLRPLPTWFRWWGWRHVSHFVGVHPRLGEYAHRCGFRKGEVSVIGNALRLERLRQRPQSGIRASLGVPRETLLGLVVGSLSHQKGQDLLVDAVASMESSGVPPFCLLVVGGDGEREFASRCREEAERRGLADTIRFIGACNDVPGLLQEADFGVIASRSESGPLVLIEFMAASLPVVATETGDVTRRATEHGLKGTVPPGDVPALAHGLRQLLTMKTEQRRRRGELGREIAHEHFSIEKVLPVWHKIYTSAISV